MSIATVIEAAADLKDVQDQIDALQAEKTGLQTRIAAINASLDSLRLLRDQRVATLKTEAGTI